MAVGGRKASVVSMARSWGPITGHGKSISEVDPPLPGGSSSVSRRTAAIPGQIGSATDLAELPVVL